MLGLAPAPNDSSTAAVAHAEAEPAAEGAPLRAAANPLRKQTLLGVGPSASHASDAADSDAQSSTTTGDAPSDGPSTLDLAPGGAVSAAPVSAVPSSVVTSTTDADAGVDAGGNKGRSRRWLWLGGAVLAAAAGIALVAGQRPDSAPPLPAPRAAAEREQAPASPPEAAKGDDTAKNDDTAKVDDSPAVASPPPEAAPAESAAAPLDSASPAGPTADTTSAPAASTPATVGEGGPAIPIQVVSDPPGARLFWRGKAVGTTPFVLELQPGEKHAYELGMPGYVTRRVVLDGSKREISIGLRPDPAAPPSPKPRK